MLHQTQVRTVAPVYEAFLEAFPTVEALAAAPLEAVKAITDALGYKVRGPWLKAIAEAVVRQHGGRVPDTVAALVALPGVGRYTAGAVASFAYGRAAPIVETNVERVLGRVFGVDAPSKTAARGKRLWALADAVIRPGGAPTLNQALMDFGAQVCTARKPACLICPMRGFCRYQNPALGPAARYLAGGEPLDEAGRGAVAAEAPAVYGADGGGGATQGGAGEEGTR